MFAHQCGIYCETRRGSRSTDALQNMVKGGQRHTGPRLTDLREQTMLNRIPFRRARGIMTHRDRHAKSIGELDLELLFPTA